MTEHEFNTNFKAAIKRFDLWWEQFGGSSWLKQKHNLRAYLTEEGFCMNASKWKTFWEIVDGRAAEDVWFNRPLAYDWEPTERLIRRLLKEEFVE